MGEATETQPARNVRNPSYVSHRRAFAGARSVDQNVVRQYKRRDYFDLSGGLVSPLHEPASERTRHGALGTWRQAPVGSDGYLRQLGGNPLARLRELRSSNK